MKIQPGVGHIFDSSSMGFSIDTSEQFPASTIPDYHPFEVIGITYDVSSSTWLYQVVPGTLNNECAQILEDSIWVYLNRTSGGIPDWPVSDLSPFDPTTHKCYIYLRAGVDGTSGNFPGEDDTDDEWPRIVTSDTLLVDTDTYGYVLIAEATEGAGPVCTVNQYVTGSLWGDRLKTGTATARYYYARI